VIQVCRAEACQSCGGEAIWDLAEKQLGCKAHENSANGMFSLEPVYCLGLCASSPAVQIGDKLHARVNETKFTRLVQALESAS
jgi:formate dehydrogenase subunit gamma